MVNKFGVTKSVEKVKVERIEEILFMENTTIPKKNKVVKNYVYTTQARIIA